MHWPCHEQEQFASHISPPTSYGPSLQLSDNPAKGHPMCRPYGIRSPEPWADTALPRKDAQSSSARRLSVFPSLFWRHSGLTSLVCFCKPLPGCELLETASGNNTHSERSRLISGTDWGSFRGSWRSAWSAFVRESRAGPRSSPGGHVSDCVPGPGQGEEKNEHDWAPFCFLEALRLGQEKDDNAHNMV